MSDECAVVAFMKPLREAFALSCLTNQPSRCVGELKTKKKKKKGVLRGKSKGQPARQIGREGSSVERKGQGSFAKRFSDD